MDCTWVGIGTVILLVGAFLALAVRRRQARRAKVRDLAATTVTATTALLAEQVADGHKQWLSHCLGFPGEVLEHVVELFSDDEEPRNGIDPGLRSRNGTDLHDSGPKPRKNGVTHNGSPAPLPSAPQRSN